MIRIENELRDRAYRCACDHGFHHNEYPSEHWLMLILSEMSEVVQADRKNRHANSDYFKSLLECSVSYNGDDEKERNHIFKVLFEREIKDTVEDELTDIVIRCLDFAGLEKIDLIFLDDEIISKICPQLMTTLDVRNIQNPYLFPFRFKSYTVLMYELTHDFILKRDIKDIIIRVFLIAKVHDIDLYWHIEQKMKYNELRPILNGKAY